MFVAVPLALNADVVNSSRVEISSPLSSHADLSHANAAHPLQACSVPQLLSVVVDHAIHVHRLQLSLGRASIPWFIGLAITQQAGSQRSPVVTTDSKAASRVCTSIHAAGHSRIGWKRRETGVAGRWDGCELHGVVVARLTSLWMLRRRR